MNQYHPDTVFSSIDSDGRYRFSNQGPVNHWNLSILAGALLPLFHENEELAVEKAKAVLAEYPGLFRKAYYSTMASKLGITTTEADSQLIGLIDQLLLWMQRHDADYTNTFLYLQGTAIPDAEPYASDTFKQWEEAHRSYLKENKIDKEARLSTMKRRNPVFIPRNHLVEEALEEVYDSGKMQKLYALWRLMLNPYHLQDRHESFMQVPPKNETYQTFCGT
jgi:uncharacterized protein YdiU (UPF0061 family)